MQLAETTTVEDRIRAATLSCICRWGVQKTTLDDVARAAGLSRATVYRTFPGGRDALLRAVAEAEVRTATEAVASATAGAADLEDLLVRGITAAGRWFAGHAALQHLVADEPEVVLPHVSFAGLERLLTALGAFAAPLLAPWVGEERAADGADWVCRIVLSHLFCPAPGADMADEASVRTLVQRFVLPGLGNSS